jgi:hypothetical protein
LRWKYDIERTYFSAERSAYRDLREVSHGAKATRFHSHISAKNTGYHSRPSTQFLPNRTQLHHCVAALSERALIYSWRVKVLSVGCVTSQDHAIELGLVRRHRNDRRRFAGLTTRREQLVRHG